MMKKMKWIRKLWMNMFVLSFLVTLSAAQDHLIISEVVTSPTEGEFIEIYNPTGAAVDLSHYHVADFKTYYELTTGTFTDLGFADFCAGFPEGTTLPDGETMVIAVFGADFESEYGVTPDFELMDSDGDDTYPDMVIDSSRISTSALSNSDEMLILFKWEGVSEVVQDVDYVIWGDNTGNWVDKTGIGTYLNDTPVATQLTVSPEPSSSNGYRLLRAIAGEMDETQAGGNGITGHDETSENFAAAFLVSLSDANPGEFGFRGALSGDGHASLTPAATEANQEITIHLKIWGDVPDPLSTVEVTIPQEWVFSHGDISVSGDGFDGASLSVDGNMITITNADVTSMDTGMVSIADIYAEGDVRTDTFYIATAVDAETPVEIAFSPTINVTPGVTSIADIQANEDDYLGETVKIRGVIVVGSGVLRTDMTNVYIVDDTGAGIEIFNFNYDDQFTRGDSLELTGIVGTYSDVTQITDYTVNVLAEDVALPKPLNFETGEMFNDTEFEYEGYWIKMVAPITDKYYAGGGYNIKIDDGTGEITIRIWDTSGLTLDYYNIGDSIEVKGIETIYSNAPQLSTSYQEDIRLYSQSTSLADGSGIAILSAETVDVDSLLPEFKITLIGSVPDTITHAVLTIPYEWDTTAVESNVQVSGQDASISWKSEDNFKHLILESLRLLQDDSIEILFSDIRTPDMNVLSTWHIKTAGGNGTLDDIGAAPQVTVGNADSVIVPIYDIQRAINRFPSDVTIEGVVTIGANVLRTDRTSAYMQDGSGFGINISSRNIYDQLERGVKVRIEGGVSDYNKTTQIEPSTIMLLDTIPVPEPRRITTQEVNDPKFDGTYVKIWGVVTELYSTAPGDYNITISDGSGPAAIRIWGTTGISTDKVETGEDALWVSGVGGVYVTETEDLYQLLPGYEDDFVIDPDYEGSLSNVNLDLPPHPFVPDMGEQLKVTFNAGAVYNHVVVRIFDLQGRIVKTLFDEDVTVVSQTIHWDGKDQYGRYADLGTYICHLEVVINRNGKHKVKTAPIVIGTMLK